VVQLANKVALITGAGSGIGAGTASVFAREGAKVAVVDLRPAAAELVAAEIRARGGLAEAIPADVANEGQVRAAVERTVERFGGLNVVFANAGINGMLAPIEELTLGEWHQIINTNLTGTFLTVKHAIRHLREAGGGSIITTASLHGTALFSMAGYAGYGASKAGQIGFVKMAAAELARWKIRVNALVPGGVITNIGERTYQRNLEKISWEITMPKPFPPLTERYATPEETGEVVLFLASDASRHVTGTAIFSDAGIALYR
jgi:NAD(P)-dependent dehydrogenase (short-subunit alcohol dehydrogenase family)